MIKIVCKNCVEEFEIDSDDLLFYEKMDVPHPTHCPDCRRQRRFSCRNERNLYSRACDLCEKKIISVFPAETQYTVYCTDCWWSDKWDSATYAKDFDFGKSFFEQFSLFEKSIPHFALFQEGEQENCQYINHGVGNKSCYLALCAFCEDVYYSHSAGKSRSCMDCTKIFDCELCYECVDCIKGYKLLFSQGCNNCSSSFFLKDCIGCHDCFCCSGLRNQKYVFENKQLSKEEYEKKLENMRFTNETIAKYKELVAEISLKIPKKYIHGINNENVTGDYIDNSKNLKNCFDCMEIEGLAYCEFCGLKGHNLYDCSYSGIGCESCYEINGTTNHLNCKFFYYGRENSDCQYSQICSNSHHLFGCFGLKYKSYCIFNKQYSPEEYGIVVSKIIEHMRKSGEYGEFFPISISPFAYNETVAYEHFPLSKNEVLEKGWRWRDIEQKSIISDALKCKQCLGNFKIITAEENFYKKFGLPIPEFCYECRHKSRFKMRNAFKLYDRKCQKCALSFKTSYAPDRPEILYCEKCYAGIF